MLIHTKMNTLQTRHKKKLFDFGVQKMLPKGAIRRASFNLHDNDVM